MKTTLIGKIKRSIIVAVLATCASISNFAQAQTTLDLLILYDNYTANYFGGNPQGAMQNWVNTINAAYSASQVDVRLRLVGVRHMEQNGSNMTDVLHNLRSNNAAISLRDQLGADFVAQIHQTGACGVAYVAVNPNWTWSVNGPQCGPIVLAHELGHNMGLHHSRRQGNDSGTRYRYGVGHGVDNTFVSIMAYSSAFNAPRVSRFSNPNIQCNGVPCGVPVGHQQEAYAALAINNVRQEMANFRHPPSVSGPVRVYEHCNYGGYEVALPVGSYNLSQLQERGVINNDISSVRVQSGYRIDMFQNGNFTGNMLTKTADDNCFVDDGFNDLTSSIVVSQTSSGFSQTIQAQNFFASAGVQLENTTDVGGGQNVGWIDAGDWMAYSGITIPSSGNYRVEYRVASLNGGGRLSLDLNGGSVVLGQRDIPNTGGWQNWTTVSHTVHINAGTYNFGIFAQSGGWNINWWRITRI